MKLIKTGFLIIFITAILSCYFLAQQNQGKESIQELAAKLRDNISADEKFTYIHKLQRSRPQTEEERQLLMELVDEEDVEIKAATIMVLGQIKEERAVPIIIQNLKYDDDQVQATSAWALG